MARITGVPSTHLEAIQQYQKQYAQGLAEGQFSSLVYPRDGVVAFLFILYLLIPHDRFPLVRSARLPLYALVLYVQVGIIRSCRSIGWASGFAIGILGAWTIIWSATFFLFTNPQRDFKRIRRSQMTPEQRNPTRDDAGQSTAVDSTTLSEFEQRHSQHKRGHAPDGGSLSDEGARSSPSGSGTTGHRSDRESKASVEYYWQPYPSHSFVQRLSWVFDLVTNLRGLGWNWQIPGLQGPPEDIRGQLKKDDAGWERRTSPSSTKSGNSTCYTREALLRRTVPRFIIYYFLLDLGKLVMMKDPYFWGFVDAGVPEYLPQVLRDSAGLARTYRLLLTLTMMYISLQEIFLLAPLVFVGILSPKLINAWAEPWLCPDFWGSYANVFDHGLAGWWSGWWHQSFRVPFGAPSAWLFSALGSKGKTPPAKLLQYVVAFMLSGFLHACGSYTQFPPTRPLRGPFSFFMLQPLGILVQMAATHLFKRLGLAGLCPMMVRQVVSFVYVHVWFFYTGPLLLDDFARGGVWLYEPVPVSPLRALGFGLKEQGWFCWGWPIRGWHQGRHWWQSGVVL